MRLTGSIYSGDKPGIRGGFIYLNFSENKGEVNPGDLLTYDYRQGVGLRVDDVRGGTLCRCVVVNLNPHAWFPVDKLKEGVTFHIIRPSFL